jgi:hypothetical protein
MGWDGWFVVGVVIFGRCLVTTVGARILIPICIRFF